MKERDGARLGQMTDWCMYDENGLLPTLYSRGWREWMERVGTGAGGGGCKARIDDRLVYA